MKTAVFITFRCGLKGPKMGLALIWRYFFEGFKFLKKGILKKRIFRTFLRSFIFGEK
jgi:hypothetical protein